ncbi:MAG: hypothetical protein Q8941_06720 [Bacteroidota bacterium]|nr:hypothetical protein [Bacteroidota bacterium]
MRLITITLLLLSCFIANAQKGWFWANLNKSPKLAKIFSTDAQSGTGARTHSLTNVPIGALIVITTQSEDDIGDASISSSPSLTWTKRADAQTFNSGNAEIWTATFAAGGSITITSNFGSNNQSSVAWVITGQESSPGGATKTATFQITDSATITTTRANSILICVSSDWRAVDGSSRTYRDNATEVYYFFASAATTGYHYYKLAPTVASYKEGLTAPTSPQNGFGTAILEVRSP